MTLLFPVSRPFNVLYSSDDTWDVTVNNLLRFANGMQLQVSHSYNGDRNIAQGEQLSRSSVDIGFTMPIMDGRGEFIASVTDLFNEFSIRQNIVGDGFNAMYENYFETQVLGIGAKYTF